VIRREITNKSHEINELQYEKSVTDLCAHHSRRVKELNILK
jgi:hypothetical protein